MTDLNLRCQIGTSSYHPGWSKIATTRFLAIILFANCHCFFQAVGKITQRVIKNQNTGTLFFSVFINPAL